MGRPLIGITCGTNALTLDAGHPQDLLNTAYSRSVLEAGGIPVILPNLADPDSVGTWLERLDGLLLSGGYDLDPALYGETKLNDTVQVDAPRDAFEIPLIREAAARDLPVLGICRGIQSLNVALGGTLFQDIPTQNPSPIQHRQPEGRDACTHQVVVMPGSLAARAAGAEGFAANSFHHQAVNEVAPGLVVSGRADDGVVEALEALHARFILGVQFHPEELTAVSAEARRLFRAFVGASAGR